jgi:hypothetical protein
VARLAHCLPCVRRMKKHTMGTTGRFSGRIKNALVTPCGLGRAVVAVCLVPGLCLVWRGVGLCSACGRFAVSVPCTFQTASRRCREGAGCKTGEALPPSWKPCPLQGGVGGCRGADPLLYRTPPQGYTQPRGRQPIAGVPLEAPDGNAIYVPGLPERSRGGSAIYVPGQDQPEDAANYHRVARRMKKHTMGEPAPRLPRRLL